MVTVSYTIPNSTECWTSNERRGRPAPSPPAPHQPTLLRIVKDHQHFAFLLNTQKGTAINQTVVILNFAAL